MGALAGATGGGIGAGVGAIASGANVPGAVVGGVFGGGFGGAVFANTTTPVVSVAGQVVQADIAIWTSVAATIGELIGEECQ